MHSDTCYWGVTMRHRVHSRARVGRLLGLLATVLLGSSAAAAANRVTPFALRVDMAKADALSLSREPKADTVQDLVAPAERGTDLKITARAKQLGGTFDSLQIEVYVENLQVYPIDQVVVQFTAASGVAGIFDYTTDAYSKEALPPPYVINAGRIAGNGIKRLILGTKKSFAPTLTGTISFAPSSGSGQTTTNLLVSPLNDELWVVSTDTAEVVVFALPGKQEIARIPVGARPSGLALQQERDWIVVASAGSNTVAIIDRKTKAVLNTLGQGDVYGRELRYVMTSQKSPTIYVSSYVEGILSKIDLDQNAQVLASATVEIGARPSGMSITADESYLYVAHYLPRGDIQHNEGWLSLVNLATFAKERETILEDLFNPGNPRLQCLADFYNNYLPAKLIYGQLSARDFSLEGVSSQLSGVFLDPSGQTAWVPGTRITGALVVLERGANADKSLTRFGGLQPAQLSAPLLFPFDASGKSQLKEYYTRDVEMAIPTLKDIVTCMRHPIEIEFIDRSLQNYDKEQSNPFLAYGIPHAGLTGLGLVNTITFSKGGRKAFLLSHTSDEIAIYDGVTMNPASQLHMQLSGDNPKGMTLTPDGKKAYVLYENSPFISELDTSAYAADDAAQLPQPYEIPYYYLPTSKNLVQLGGVVGLPLIRNIEQVPLKPQIEEVAQISLVAKDPLPAPVRRGKILFQTANPDKYTVSANRLGACASCHPNGGNDGSSWVTMEGPRRTMSLRGGLADRGWLHISATHANAQEFAETIVPERLGGSLTPDDQDAMVMYLNYGIPKLQNPRVDLVRAKHGGELFQQKCAGCHAGPAYTSGVTAAGEPRLFNIGSGSVDHSVASGRFSNRLIGLADAKSEQIATTLKGDRDLGPGDEIQKILDYRQRPVRKFGQFKAPSLVGVFDNAVFFHDASVDNLKDAISRINTLLHLNLSDSDVGDLEQYLKTL